MKIQPDKFDGQIITGYGPGWIAVNGERVHHSLILGTGGQRLEWSCGSFASLSSDHFGQLAGLGAEVVVFGSGGRLRFPKPEWLAARIARRIGIETMDTQAACRTYNILAGEGRSVLVALLIEQTA